MGCHLRTSPEMWETLPLRTSLRPPGWAAEWWQGPGQARRANVRTEHTSLVSMKRCSLSAIHRQAGRGRWNHSGVVLFCQQMPHGWPFLHLKISTEQRENHPLQEETEMYPLKELGATHTGSTHGRASDSQKYRKLSRSPSQAGTTGRGGSLLRGPRLPTHRNPVALEMRHNQETTAPSPQEGWQRHSCCQEPVTSEPRTRAQRGHILTEQVKRTGVLDCPAASPDTREEELTGPSGVHWAARTKRAWRSCVRGGPGPSLPCAWAAGGGQCLPGRDTVIIP